MCRKGNSNQRGNFNREAAVKCPRCNARVPIKIGSKNNGWNKEVKCTHCPNIILFHVDESGKAHVHNSRVPKHVHALRYLPKEEIR